MDIKEHVSEKLKGCKPTVSDDLCTITIKDVNIVFKQNDKKFEIEQNKHGTVLDQHIYRLLKSMFPNKIKIKNIDIVCESIEELLLDIYSNCTICGKKLDFKSTRIDNCKKEECEMEYDITVTSNIVISLYRQSKSILTFLIKTSIDAMNDIKNQQIFSPFPYNLVSSIKKRDKLDVNKIEYDKDFMTLVSIIPDAWKSGDVSLKELEYIDSDVGVYAVYGEKLYGYLKFLLTTNKTDLYQRTIDMYTDDKHKHKLDMYEIHYDRDTEDKYKDGIYLFHGSGKQNWYSILRNGLKNCSKSQLMRHGAARGSGIYFAENIQTSFGYGPIVGVCKVNNIIKTGNGIHVVTNEENVLLKYIITGHSRTANLHSVIDKYFSKLDNQKTFNVIQSTTSLANRRLVKELSMIKDSNIKVSYEDIFKLSVEMSGFKNKLDKSLKQLKMNSITLSVKISPNYPTVPPLIAVKTPLLKSRYINEGAIMLDILSQFRWKISNRIYDMLRIIQRTLMEEDSEAYSGEYDIDNAYNIFKAKEIEYK